MNKAIRRLALLLGAVAVFAAGPLEASAAEQSQAKYYFGPGGSTLCTLPYQGQSFAAQENTQYVVDAKPVVGRAVTQACIRFLKADGKWTAPKYFGGHDEGTVPDDAVEAWIVVTHTDPEASYAPVVVPVPTEITYTDGIED